MINLYKSCALRSYRGAVHYLLLTIYYYRTIDSNFTHFFFFFFFTHNIRTKIEHLKISRKEYLNILKNRGIKISSNISTDKLLRKVKFFKKADFRYIADTRGANKTNDMSTDDLIKAIYTHLHKKKQDTITEILKE